MLADLVEVDQAVETVAPDADAGKRLAVERHADRARAVVGSHHEEHAPRLEAQAQLGAGAGVAESSLTVQMPR